MANAEDTFKRTMKTKAALDLFRAFKRFQDLLEDGVDSQTAFLQAFWGIYYVTLPIPRPDYVGTIGELHKEMIDAHAHLSQLTKESEGALTYIKNLVEPNPPK